MVSFWETRGKASTFVHNLRKGFKMHACSACSRIYRLKTAPHYILLAPSLAGASKQYCQVREI
jgi:hypothetical protein